MNKQNIQGSYPLMIFDGAISQQLHDQVWQFLLNGEYCVNHYDHHHSLWYPREDRWYTPRTRPAALRFCMAWDEQSLRDRAPVVSELWQNINQVLNDAYLIDGVPESMNYMVGISPLNGIQRADGSPGVERSAWRVYGEGIDKEYRARTKAIHRDSIYLDRDDYWTLMYCANSEWHPQQYGELVFHSDHAHTGDYTGKFEPDQPRNYPIGDAENIVSWRPGRFVLWEARYLHQMKPAALYSPQNLMLISFRLRRKK